MRRRIRRIGEPLVPLTDTYPKGVFFVGSGPAYGGGQIEGTSFLIGMNEGAHCYVVTAAHVVEPFPQTFVRIPLTHGTGEAELVELDVPEWVLDRVHDVAVAPIDLPHRADAVATDLSQFIDDPIHQKPDDWFRTPFKIELGDVVYFIGLLGKIPAMTDAGIPMVRSGTLGRMWQERVPVVTPEKVLREITAHLIDCRSFAGFSGSPCYVQQSRAGIVDGGVTTKYRTLLLGLIGGHWDDWAGVRDRMKREPNPLEARVSTGVGYVIPAEFIRAVLMRKELEVMRNDKDAAERAAALREAEDNAATMDSAGESEFERFEDLTRKLVNTPKSALDEKRKEQGSE
jgi:hypothetical protein